MVDAYRIQTVNGKRADRWLYDYAMKPKVVKSSRDKQSYNLYSVQRYVKPFVERKEDEEDVVYHQEYVMLDDDERENLFKEIKNKQSGRGRGRGRGAVRGRGMHSDRPGNREVEDDNPSLNEVAQKSSQLIGVTQPIFKDLPLDEHSEDESDTQTSRRSSFENQEENVNDLEGEDQNKKGEELDKNKDKTKDIYDWGNLVDEYEEEIKVMSEDAAKKIVALNELDDVGEASNALIKDVQEKKKVIGKEIATGNDVVEIPNLVKKVCVESIVQAMIENGYEWRSKQ
ncbi:unnamed protein product [Acanthoscelides obtectus]|uniref:Uncharacterized protein n=1 Tax=Acanthoscelides obtectus TaxID=200917 RepID=A0A9P0KF84_ACAOB|nr:unnamed protein product [Acanthoscelides obtectus]CAK1681671.1 hypothetical protein AOBTE_LOCUS33203 [Acanthoscelides obtectus]